MPRHSEILAEAQRLLARGDNAAATSLFQNLLKASPGDPIALEFLGVRAVKAGDFDTAITHLKSAVAHPHGRASALFQLGHALRDSGRLAEAADVYNQFIGRENSPDGAVTLADVYLSLDRPGHAQSALEKALSWRPDDVKALALMASSLDRQGNAAGAESCRHKALSTTASAPEADLIKGALWLDLGEPQKAFAAAAERECSLFDQPLLDVYAAFDRKAAWERLPALQGDKPEDTDEPLILVSGDLNYVRRYGANLIRSANLNAPKCTVHVHAVLTREDPPDLALDDGLQNHSVSWEVEPQADKATFATRRFVRLTQWRQMRRHTIVTLDIDSIVNRDITDALAQLPPFDVALYDRKEELFLPQRIAAGAVCLADTPAAQLFIDRVAAYILHFERVGRSKWFVDQMALLAARSATQFALVNTLITVVDLPAAFLDWQHHDRDSVVWTTKGSRKDLPPVG